MTNPSRAERPSARAQARPQTRSSVEFLRGFLRNPAQVGSVMPSSHQLEQRLVQCARVANANCVIELGPGTGGTTQALLRAMKPRGLLMAVELDDEFQQHLRTSINDPRFILQHGNAEHLEAHLQSHGLPAPDAIVSGIPFSTMPPRVSNRIAMHIAHALRPGGRFVAYQVRAHVADFMSPYLGEPHREWEIVNVPPVRVFTWLKG